MRGKFWVKIEDRAAMRRTCRVCKQEKSGALMKVNRQGDYVYITTICRKCHTLAHNKKICRHIKVFEPTEFEPVKYTDETFGFDAEYRQERHKQAYLEIQRKLYMATKAGLDIDDEQYTEEIIRRFG